MKRASLGGHTPVNLNSLNDDALEKKKAKEKSRKEREFRRSSALHSITPRRESLGGPGYGSPFNSSYQVPVLSNFEEWIKLATDNKINSTNTWNFALIDYFHDMSLLRDGEAINFQKASCTLDGCVKIYTSRIDSVATETGKLLSGLANDSKTLGEIEESSENVEEEEGRKKRERKRANRSVNTLAKDFESLRAKRFELEGSFDPLFKKMCADFDEDGAKGLLMNHLSVDQHGKIVFDSSDAIIKDLEGNDDPKENVLENNASEDPETGNENKSTYADGISLEALGSIQKRYFIDIDQLTICPSLQGFEFDNKGNLDVSLLKSLSDEVNMIAPNSLLEEQAAMNGDVEIGSLPTDSEEDDNDNEQGHIVHALEDMAYGDENIDLSAKPLDEFEEPNKSIHDDTEAGETINLANNSVDNLSSINGIYEYFDKSIKKNWAGPEHWRIQALRKRSVSQAPGMDSSNVSEGVDNTRVSNSLERRRRREADNTIDFSKEVDLDSLFTPASGNLKLPKSHWKKRNRCLLPDDYQYDSRRLLQLFLKPKVSLLPFTSFNGETGVKQVFEGQDEADTAPIYPTGFDDDSDGGDMDGQALHEFDGGSMQEFRENTTSPTPPSSAGFGENLLLNARLAKPDSINYAKRAKRVDVKVLKENIWKCLDLEENNSRETSKSNVESNPEGDDELKEEEKEEPVRTFSSTVAQLENMYGQKDLKDISTSFAFICLLHLANENALNLTSNEDFSDVFIQHDPNLTSLEEMEKNM
ncbi:condensin complex non-SMC subunit Cnd2 [Schizosaccharomyces cryophilus OY26]|uniref:Condensin complex subunit 2 n=1 Tax=Schizosaccharomyces cryophilus (strain OY26 / ATCC MYA-4695 / CBS 11777 / NBRC 106824 / NRRL Y48691) TaxID=653667 RepID=S9VV86_SCHCR|nr:condensin complex non-SMC subunit Cnd2 [Schizosaccharomyces cryophilus OY26]EPY49985.1 condensin complex non-SMC subunit Cnd2 [Schizosaccharomyces cryophilus OY26]